MLYMVAPLREQRFRTVASKYLGHTDPIKVQTFGLLTARMKISQLPYAIFQATLQFLFKLCNTLQCHGT